MENDESLIKKYEYLKKNKNYFSYFTQQKCNILNCSKDFVYDDKDINLYKLTDLILNQEGTATK